MRRRSRLGGQPPKSLRRKAVTSGRSGAPQAMRGGGSSPAGQEAKTAQLARELKEALDQQRATSDVLRIIASNIAKLPDCIDLSPLPAALVGRGIQRRLLRRA